VPRCHGQAQRTIRLSQPTLGSREPATSLEHPGAQLGDRKQSTADELVEAFIAEHWRHVVGVLGPKAHQSAEW
jgi:hypothetical protein